MIDLNIYAYIILGIQLLGVATTPLLFGKEREPVTYTTWVAQLIGTFLMLKALGVF